MVVEGVKIGKCESLWRMEKFAMKEQRFKKQFYFKMLERGQVV